MGNELSFRLEGASVPLHVTLPRGGVRGAQDFASGDQVSLRPQTRRRPDAVLLNLHRLQLPPWGTILMFGALPIAITALYSVLTPAK